MDASAQTSTVLRLTAIIESAPTAMVMVDDHGRIVLLNRAAETLFGYAREELLGQAIEVLVPRRFRGQHPSLRSGYFAAPVPRPMGAGRDLFGLRKDGSEVPVEIGLNPIPSAEGLFVLSAIVDITERKQLEAALRQANEQLEARVQERTAQLARQAQALERSNQELQQFAYIASHDLQSPLRTISGFSQLLQSEYGGVLSEQADDWIERIVQATQQMQTLINDVLEYSRIGTHARPFRPVPFGEVLRDTLALLDGSIRDLGAVVTWDELPVVTGDRSQLVQVMQNLISNALKYHGSETPRIHVSAGRTDDEWVIGVRDNGIGIDPRHHERIFEIFRRLHNQRDYPGTGIGLAVCSRVVYRHGGRIWVESQPGQGSTFFFTIPVSHGDESVRKQTG